MTKKVSSKNGLVELFRFLCSLWVAYFHGFSPVLSDKFNGENISTDFFFIVSGFFFLKSFQKYIEGPFAEGTRFIFWGRIKRFIVPLAIAALSVLYCNIAFPLDLGFNWPLSFLWFFVAQSVYLFLFYLLKKRIGRLSSFNIACAIIIAASLSLCIFDLRQFYRVLRGLAMVGIGILVSQMPKFQINIKNETKAEKLGILINALGFAVSALSFAYLAYLPGQATWKLHLLCVLICPALLHFANALPVHSKLLNLLGELSIFIYLAQCPILINYYYGSRDTMEQFPLLCIWVFVLFIINRSVNRKAKKARGIDF